jgi:hypothetical protein
MTRDHGQAGSDRFVRRITTDKREASAAGRLRSNALALTKPPHFAHLEFDFVECWERFGKELNVSKHLVSRTESIGHMFLVRAHNPKVVSSNLTPATMGAYKANPLSALLIYGYELSRNNSFA